MISCGSCRNRNGTICDVSRLQHDTRVWHIRNRNAGSGVTRKTADVLQAFAEAADSASYASKIKLILPMVGTNLLSARLPYRDSVNAGHVQNVSSNFVDADFSENTGLQGNGAGKVLWCNGYDLGALSGTTNGGFGFWETNISLVSPGHCYGARSASLFTCYLDYPTPRILIYWGTGNKNYAGLVPGNNHYYIQFTTSGGMRFFINGALYDTDGTNNFQNSGHFHICGIDGSFTGPTRCGLYYLTNGALTDADVANWHEILKHKLILATGKLPP